MFFFIIVEVIPLLNLDELRDSPLFHFFAHIHLSMYIFSAFNGYRMNVLFQSHNDTGIHRVQ